MTVHRKKHYKITMITKTGADTFETYLKAWQVNPKSYKRNGLIFTTKDTNVVDVCTESFVNPSIEIIAEPAP